MKGIHIFCASQAATAICLTMEQPSSSSSSSLPLGSSPAIDRYNPIIRDSTRIPTSLPPNSHPPLTPKLHHKKKKKNNNNKRISSKENHQDQANNTATANTSSFAKLDDDQKLKNSNGITTTRKGWSCNVKPGDFISPPGSTRYLLREKVLFNALSDSDPVGKLFLEETSKSKDVITEEICDVKPPASSPSHPDQVVILRVSLHCRGCERKMRKHLSRMEGVTSFNIDFAAKKVTVTGNVTPLGVLSSISKVKNAQLWSPSISSQIPPPSLSPGFKNEYRGSAI
ncbi:protein SODIUM POTASSIUM ROOT defective [Sesamum alatum]|uniref:Protein SODIUM POTASSIUM ROOT defective n=1 Tax=Sesamum alatum TaxID=300844 RepID=A0AAE1YM66_9LAMI|nr:protein SODIUM POTASSIUM ROOT defective [Sesamum alatum]